MLQIERKGKIFTTKELWFSDYPFEVRNCDKAVFMDCREKTDLIGFKRTPATTLVIDLTQKLEDIWRDMDKSSCRYDINKAQKEGITIKTNQNYEEFYEVNKSFREKKDLLPGYEVPKRQIEYMKHYGTLFTSELDGETLGGQFFLKDERNMRMQINASKRLEVGREKARIIGYANRLAIWEAIKYGKDIGLVEFDFGGYYTGEKKDEQKEKSNAFKKSFGGKLAMNYIYEKYYSKRFSLLVGLSELKQRVAGNG
jgi:hypothetical protein